MRSHSIHKSADRRFADRDLKSGANGLQIKSHDYKYRRGDNGVNENTRKLPGVSTGLETSPSRFDRPRKKTRITILTPSGAEEKRHALQS
jgi:hypothetical protein